MNHMQTSNLSLQYVLFVVDEPLLKGRWKSYKNGKENNSDVAKYLCSEFLCSV